LSVVSPVVGLTPSTRAVSRMPLAFRAISTICQQFPVGREQREERPRGREEHRSEREIERIFMGGGRERGGKAQRGTGVERPVGARPQKPTSDSVRGPRNTTGANGRGRRYGPVSASSR
jgi:hypothetical protein